MPDRETRKPADFGVEDLGGTEPEAPAGSEAAWAKTRRAMANLKLPSDAGDGGEIDGFIRSIAMALQAGVRDHDFDPDEAFDLWREWIEGDPLKSHKADRARWDRCANPREITLGTLYHHAGMGAEGSVKREKPKGAASVPTAVWEISQRDQMVFGDDVYAWTKATLRDGSGKVLAKREVFGPTGIESEQAMQRLFESYRDETCEANPTDRNLKLAAAIDTSTRNVHRLEVCDLTKPPHDESEDFIAALGTSLPRDGFFAAFGSRKSGKSWMTRYLAMDLAHQGIRVAWIDVEDGTAGDNYARMAVHGLPSEARAVVAGNILRLTGTHISTAPGIRELAGKLKTFGAEYLIVDSATAACAGEINQSQSATVFYERLRSLPVRGGFVINHTAKGNRDKTGEDGATALGSTVWESIPRGIASVRAERKGAWDRLDEVEDPFAREPDGEIREGVATWDVEVKVSASNGRARAGEGCILRVCKEDNVVVFHPRWLKPKTYREQAQDRRNEERERVEKAMGDRVLNARQMRAAISSEFPSGIKAADADVLVERGVKEEWIARTKRGRAVMHVLAKHAAGDAWQATIGGKEKGNAAHA